MTYLILHMGRARRALAIAVAALALLAAYGAAVASASPDSTPEAGSAEVDGFISDWDTGISEPPSSISDSWPSGPQWSASVSAPSYFADMYRAARTDKPVESRLWLRWDCRSGSSGTLYALVLAKPGVYIQSSGDQHIKDGINRMLVDSGYAADGAPPDFAWVKRSGSLARGWEASVDLTGDISLNVHAQVIDGGSQTSAVKDRGIPLHIPTTCTPTPRVTATTTYNRTFDWTIDKTASPTSVTSANPSSPISYSVVIDKSEPIDSGYKVTGAVTNVSGSFTVRAYPESGGTVECTENQSAKTYVCDLPSPTSSTGVVTVTYGSGGSISKAYAFGDPAVVTRNSVTLEDNYGGATFTPIGPSTITGDLTYPYTSSVSLPDAGCRDHVNTARIKSGGTVLDSDEATVRLCRIGPPSATAVTTFDRTYNWSIVKTASPATTTTMLASVNVTWSVAVTRSAPVDSGFRITGVVSNALATAVTATPTGGSPVPCVITGDQLNYSCDVPTGGTGTISITHAGGTFTKGYTFGNPTTTTRETATIEDNKRTGSYSVIGGPGYTGGTLTYTEALDTPMSGCTTWTNRARVVIGGEEIAADTADVEICRGTPPPVTANATYVRTYNWSIVKTASPTDITTAQATYDIDYRLDITRSAPVDSGFTVSGSVAGVSGDFAVTADPTGAEPAVACTEDQAADTYTCAVLTKTDGTVTVTFPGGTTTQDYAFGSPSSTTRATATIEDNKGTGTYVSVGTVTGSNTIEYTLPVDVPASDCRNHVNIARVVSDGTPVANDDATVRLCRTPPPPPSGAAPSLFATTNPTFTRTNTWTVQKKTLDATGTWAELAQLETDTDSALATYQVAIDKTSVDSSPVVSGTIQVSNPASASINATLAFTTPNCTAPLGLTFTVAAGQSVSRAFSCTLPAVADGEVAVTLSWTGASTGSAAYALPYDFGQPTTVIRPFVTATDQSEGAAQALRIAETYEPLTLTYSGTVAATTACPTWGEISTNTVRIYNGTATSGTPLDDDTADVQTCTFGDPEGRDTWLAASASPSFNGAYYWDLEKEFDGAQLSPDGQYVDLAYTLSMRRSTDMFASNFVIRGEAAFTSVNANPEGVLSVSVPGVAGSTCIYDDTGTRYIDIPGGLAPAETFSPTYTCVLPRKVNAEVVIGLYEGSTSGVLSSTPLDVVRTTYFFATPTAYERRVIDVWDQFDFGDPKRKAVVSADFRTVSYVDRLQLTDVTDCDLYVNTAKVFEVGANPVTAQPIDEDSEDVFFCPWTDLEPLEMSVSLTPNYLRSYDWTLAKTLATPTLNDDGTATMSYTVDATRLDPVDGGYAVDGAVTVYNPNPFVLSGMVLRNEFAPLISCNLVEVTLTFAPYETERVPFTCTLGARSEGTLTSTIRGTGIGQTVQIQNYAFSDLASRDVNGTASVFDRFASNSETPLPGGTGISGTSSFTYTRTVPITRGCVIYPNTARLTTPDGLQKVSQVVAQICLQGNGDVLYINEQSITILLGKFRNTSSSSTTGLSTLSASGLKITKIGPSRAKPGQVVTYRVKVTNSSFSPISGITLMDALPAGLRFSGALPSNGVKMGTKAKWTLTLAAGQSRTFAIKAKVGAKATGKKCNVATVRAASGGTKRAISCLTVAGAPAEPNVTG